MEEEFNVQRVLEELVTRHPDLGNISSVQDLLNKQEYEWREVVPVFHELFVQCEWNTVVCSAFRNVLLRLVGSWAAVQPMDVNLSVSIALLNAVTLAPHLKRVALSFFEIRPCPLELLETSTDMSPVDACYACFHGLDILPELRRIWSFNPWIKCLKAQEAELRWCAIHAVSKLLGLSDSNTQKLLRKEITQEQAMECSFKWQEYLSRLEYEQKRSWDVASHTQEIWKIDEENMDVDDAVPVTLSKRNLSLPDGYVDVCGLELSSREEGYPETPPRDDKCAMIVTPTVNSNLQSAALALCQSRPLLLEGPPGSGKSSLIQELARLTGNVDMVHVHIDDQTDAKSLLGAYVCTATPGEFVWQPGPLTQAVSQGKWLVIEDVNLAPPQVLAALIPLLESGKLPIPQRAEFIEAAPGLQILATVTCAPKGLSAGAYGNSDNVKEILGGLWSHVYIENPPLVEQLSILKGKYPELHFILPFAMATLHLVQLASGQGSPLLHMDSNGDNMDFSRMDGIVRECLERRSISGHDIKLHVGRHYSLRDLVKWCDRMKVLHSTLMLKMAKSVKEEDYGDVSRLPFEARQAALVESCDCFAAMLPDKEARRKLMRCFAAVWGLGDHDVDACQDLIKPNIKVTESNVDLGRIRLPVISRELTAMHQRHRSASVQHNSGNLYSHTGHAVRMMEKVAVALGQSESVLLVGDTGTGKTALVQHIAKMVGVKLMVLNLSQQSGSSDLLGGFRPVSLEDSLRPLIPQFIDLVRSTWTRGNNEVFIGRTMKYAERNRWRSVEEAFRAALGKVKNAAKQELQECADTDAASAPHHRKRKKKAEHLAPSKKVRQELNSVLRHKWLQFEEDLSRACHLRKTAESAFAFAFIEGCLMKAIKYGWWLLLDEINLAPPEVLECLAGVLDPSGSGAITVAEKGAVVVDRHENFRLIGAMNPATDSGKRDLPAALRNRFTEFWYSEPESLEDLAMMANGYLQGVGNSTVVNRVVDFYKTAKEEAERSLLDGAGHRPAYNLRTFCRWLLYVRQMAGVYGISRCLYDGASMAFLTQLDSQSARKIESTICSILLDGKDIKALLRVPNEPRVGNYVLFEQFWVEIGDQEMKIQQSENQSTAKFVLTHSVRGNLKNLARAVVLRKFPILLQGPTSSGKTSLVSYLAAETGHTLLRINNHEHTDLQEYLGTYIADETGKLVFREGALVQAVRKGYWVVLDELNLAPTEVLEALNRLLDDNRELFIPEIQETVKPHPQFMLFATQNPPGIYAGRKVLSRAFRSRFLELHVDDIPDNELSAILESRCMIAPSYAAKLVLVMKQLQRQRQSSNAFAGKHGFITPRDLFKWADREAVGYHQLAENGYLILAERLRNADEQSVVKDVLEKTMKVEIDVNALYKHSGEEPLKRLQDALKSADMNQRILIHAFQGLVWTKSMWRMYTLLNRCLESREPALLVGETGSGKTTVCQLLALMRGQKLHILNCNQHTETSDFLGGFRPTRDRERALGWFKSAADKLLASPLFDEFNHPRPIFPDSLVGYDLLKEAQKAQESADQLQAKSQQHARESDALSEWSVEMAVLKSTVSKMLAAGAAARMPFSWVDGPLVEAMKQGDIILIDELNLAEDAVLERMNSVMESGRTLTLAEKGDDPPEVIVAAEGFRIVATMNPGGDFGKKELSPALSNRFTQIWVPQIEDAEELKSIVESRLADVAIQAKLPQKIMQFWSFFRPHAAALRMALTVRDLLSWVDFINSLAPTVGPMSAYVHGCYLVLLDGLGLGVGSSHDVAVALKKQGFNFLRGQVDGEYQLVEQAAGDLSIKQAINIDGAWGLSPFTIARGLHMAPIKSSFNLVAPTPLRNGFRLLRALQLRKSILLEGSPGVGKTSLVDAIAKNSEHRLVRINLSEQTDMMDLLGADLPVPGGGPGEFQWCDGPLLGAIKAGDWVLLDELNLASQQVLEGLNAVLDHRSEVFIPELGETFKCPPTFRLFGAQNPLQEGGGRKGLPRSFLNRFTRVYIEALSAVDMHFIAGSLHSKLPELYVQKMVSFLHELHTKTTTQQLGVRGGPWEFNLRDLLRWCQLVESVLDQFELQSSNEASILEGVILSYARILFIDRFRTLEDRAFVATLLESHFGQGVHDDQPDIVLTPSHLCIGRTKLQRRTNGASQNDDSVGTTHFLSTQCRALESVATCVSQGWPCLVVGSSSSGKNSVVRVLAELCGEPLIEISLTQGTDTSDLLGGFEQMEIPRMVKEVYKTCNGILHIAVDALLMGHNKATGSLDHVQGLTRLLSVWESLDNSISENHKLGSQATNKELLDEVEGLSVFCNQVKAVCNHHMTDSEAMFQQIEAVEKDICQLHNLCSSSQASVSTAGRFEWVDGALCQAMENGQWVLLNNANLCNPTVLDRLNSVLEPGGVLHLNECGGVTGEPRVIRPHPNFRLFLAYNPLHGEVSRAMRNRGTEVFILPQVTSDEVDKLKVHDVLRILFTQGIITPSIGCAMANAHFELGRRSFVGDIQPSSVRDLKQWASLTSLLVTRGWPLHSSLSTSWNQVYARRQSTEARRAAVSDILSSHCLDTLQAPYDQWIQPILESVPVGFSLTIGKYCKDSRSTAFEREIALLKHIRGAYSSTEDMSAGTQMCTSTIAERSQDDILALGLAAAKLLVERLPLSDVPHLHDWCRYVLASSRSDPGREDLVGSTSQKDLILHILVGVLNDLQHREFQTMHAAHSHTKDRESITHILPFCPFYAAAIKCKSHGQEELWWTQELHLILESHFFAGFEKMAQSQVQSAHVQSPYKHSYQMFLHPDQRGSKDAVKHPVLEWTYPLFAVVFEVEKAALDRLRTVFNDKNGASPLSHKVHMLQVWRKAVWLVCTGGLWSLNDFTADSIDLDNLSFAWLKLRKHVLEVVDMNLLSSTSFNRASHVIQGINNALELPHTPPPKPLLWKFAGHPLLAQTQEDSEAVNRLYAICDDLHCGEHGLHLDPRSRPAVFSLIGSSADAKNNETEALQHPQFGMLPDQNGEMAIASLVCDPGLRRSLLEGLSMAASSSIGYNKDQSNSHLEILHLLQQEISARALACDTQPIHGITSSLASLPPSSVIFPSSLMVDSTHRCYQIGLLLLVQCQAPNAIHVLPLVTLQCLPTDIYPSASLKKSDNLRDALQATLDKAVDDCATSVVQLVPLQCLQWLQEVEENQEMWSSWVQDMWYRWHLSFWDNVQQDVLQGAFINLETGVEISYEALHVWKATCGPGRMHQAAISVLGPALLCQSPSIADAPAKLSQLKLGLRHLYQLSAPAGRPNIDSLAQNLWASVAALFTQVIVAHISTIREEFCAPMVNIIATLVSCCGEQNESSCKGVNSEAMIKLFTEIVRTSSHGNFRAYAEKFAVPCLTILLEEHNRTAEADWVLKLGNAWALLGSLRLFLVLPPRGLDPSGKQALKVQHIRQTLQKSIQPELWAREAVQHLPGGWDESSHIIPLRSQDEERKAVLKELDGKRVLRPTPSQYRQLQRELQHFLDGMGCPDRIRDILFGLGKLKFSAVSQASTWEESARGFCKRLSTDYPLYRDILQPVQVALLEICHGLSTMGSFVYMAEAAKSSQNVQNLLPGLFSFPKGPSAADAMSCLSSKQQQVHCSDIMAHAANRGEKNSQDDLMSVGYNARMSILQSLLRSRAKDAVKRWVAVNDSSGLEGLESIFAVFLELWEELGVYQAARQEEENQIFKTKKKTTSFETDEEREEKEYQSMFPDHWEAFEDLANMDKDEVPGQEMDIDDPTSPSSKIVSDSEAATVSAQSLLEGKILHEIVFLHLKVYAVLTGKQMEHFDVDEAFKEQHNLGRALLASMGGAVPRSLDDATMSGHLFRMCIECKSLSEIPPPKPSPENVESLDPQLAITLEDTAIGEVKLCRLPLLTIISRLDLLLDEWPEHPILSQLKEIADRTLNFSVNVPLRKVLIGLELLIGRAQVWEDTAARHVSLREELKSLSGLATRWRRLELASWNTILEKRIQDHEKGAWKSWFYIYRLIKSHQNMNIEKSDGAAEFMSSLEQFLQTATIGEFSERLHLLSAFQAHLRLMASCETSTQLSHVLENLVLYYTQFEEPINKKLENELAVIRKDLKDFVKLAKWENRGYYAMKLGADRAQRKLHKLCLGADKVLKIPAVLVLTDAQKVMSFSSLEAMFGGKNVSQLADNQSEIIPATLKIAQESWMVLCNSSARVPSQWSFDHPVGKCLDLQNPELRYNQLPRLTARMQSILGQLPEDMGQEGTNFDYLAAAVASRAQELRTDTSKAAKSRKKKALSDFLKALTEIGVSKRRSAIPRGQRELFDRFRHPMPSLDNIWGSPGILESLPLIFKDHVTTQWAKSQKYYIQSLARLQKLVQIKDIPVRDISPTEKNAMAQYCQHILYLVHEQRKMIGEFAYQSEQLKDVRALLTDLIGDTADSQVIVQEGQHPLPLQKETRDMYQAQCALFTRLRSLIEEMTHLLSAIAAADETHVRSQLVKQGLGLLKFCETSITECCARLKSIPSHAHVFTHKHRSCLMQNFSAIEALYVYLTEKEHISTSVCDLRSIYLTGGTLSACLPAWLGVMDAFKEAANHAAEATCGSRPLNAHDGPVPSKFSPDSFVQAMEACVKSTLLWVQKHEGVEHALRSNDSSSEDELPEKNILLWNEAFHTSSNSIGTNGLCQQVKALMGMLAECCDANSQYSEEGRISVLHQMASMLTSLLPALSLVQAAFSRNMVRLVCLHKAVTKLAYVTTSVFLGLSTDGFCTQEECEDGATDGQDGGEFKESEGTGIGEGQGKMDVSKEIEDEDQVAGTNQDKKEEQKDEEDNGEDTTTGLEMGQDFDGEYEDVEENQNQSGSDQEGDDERLEDEMGQVGEDGNAVDERLWDQDDKKEPDRSDGEELDNDATAPVADKSQLDYLDGQDEEGNGDKDDKDEPRKDTAAGQPDVGSEFPGEDEDSEMEDNGEADQYQKEGLTKPDIPEEELELPDDMNMDGDQVLEEEQDQASVSEGEEPPIQEGSFPDDKSKDKNDADQDSKENSKDNVGDDQDEKMAEDTNPEEDDGKGDEEDGKSDPLAPLDEEEGQGGSTHVYKEGEPDDQGDEDEKQDSDEANIVQKEQEEEKLSGSEAGPKGVAAGTAADAEPLGAGDEEGKEANSGAEEEEGQQQASRLETEGANEGLQSLEEAPQSRASALGPADPGANGAPAPAEQEGQDRNQESKRPNLGSNPLRGLGDALERWKANLSITEEANQNSEDAAEQQVDAQGDDPPEAGEFQFLAEGENDKNATQTLAAATDEQMETMDAWDHQKEDTEDGSEDEHGGPAQEEEMQDGIDNDAEQITSKATTNNAGLSNVKSAPQKPALEDQMEEIEEIDEKDGGLEPGEKSMEEAGGNGDTELNTIVQMQHDFFMGGGDSSVHELDLCGGLAPEQVDAIREKIDQQLSRGNFLQYNDSEKSSGSQELWSRCQALTSNLVGELTEHLRLILEPTQASRLAGDYRSGKRINMKKVLAYVASQYRKDKIWMRRTKPDKRRYQVLLAIDDSKSMAENGCGVFALESLTLLCRAMSRLEVGELGVVNFGGAGKVSTLHPLGAPFTDASGPGLVQQMQFNQDNSIQDQPMVELITGLQHILDVAQHRHSTGGFSASSQSLHQLVLVIADGRFHEREVLKRLAHDLCNRRGVLVTFIILDNPKSSLLDLSTVSFVDGKPNFSKYLDDFPFPLYIVLQDTMALPRTLADLLRQWFQISVGH